MYVGAPVPTKGGGGSRSNCPIRKGARRPTTLRTFWISRWYHYFSSVEINLSDQATNHSATDSFRYCVKIFGLTALAGGPKPHSWAARAPASHAASSTVCTVWPRACLTVKVFRICSQEIIQSKSGWMKYFVGRAVLRFKPVGSWSTCFVLTVYRNMLHTCKNNNIWRKKCTGFI